MANRINELSPIMQAEIDMLVNSIASLPGSADRCRRIVTDALNRLYEIEVEAACPGHADCRCNA